MNKLVNSLLLFYCGLVMAETNELATCLESAYTQVERAKCAGVSYESADTELNRVYQEIRKTYKTDQHFLEKLKVSQQTWIKFRDAELAMKYPQAAEEYGTNYSMCASIYLRDLTLQRIETLKLWLRGHEEGDVCHGSVKIGSEN